MKSASSYKAVAYEDTSMHAGFWTGKAVDRQITSRILELSEYWIFHFLKYNFQVTPAAGTRRLAVAPEMLRRKRTI